MPDGAIQPSGVAMPSAPFSPVVVSGEMVYTAGQVGHDENGGIVAGGVAEQARRAFENLRLCLEAAGCAFEDVVKVNAYLTDLEDFAAYNDVYRELFREPYPARTTVGAALAPGLLVEIEAVARRPS
jgi:2-iminobutanoate/2-iminopropanoate deaminase